MEGRRILDKNEYDAKFLDVISGKVKCIERPQFKKVMDLLKENPTAELYIDDFSRLGRNTGDVITTCEALDEIGINIFCLDNGMQSRPNGETNPMWKLLVGVLSSVYELELENIKSRTQAGMMAYREKGNTWGRPIGSKENVVKFMRKSKNEKILDLLKKNRTYKEIKAITGCSESTISKVKRYSKLFEKEKVQNVSENQLNLIDEVAKQERLQIIDRENKEALERIPHQSKEDYYEMMAEALENESLKWERTKEIEVNVEPMDWGNLMAEQLREMNREK
jgi:DNA invertase Pin-like site-specific DNA recombinase